MMQCSASSPWASSTAATMCRLDAEFPFASSSFPKMPSTASVRPWISSSCRAIFVGLAVATYRSIPASRSAASISRIPGYGRESAMPVAAYSARYTAISSSIMCSSTPSISARPRTSGGPMRVRSFSSPGSGTSACFNAWRMPEVMAPAGSTRVPSRSSRTAEGAIITVVFSHELGRSAVHACRNRHTCTADRPSRAAAPGTFRCSFRPPRRPAPGCRRR